MQPPRRVPSPRRRATTPTSAVAWLAAATLIGLIVTLPHVGRKRGGQGKRLVEVWGWNIAAESLGMLSPRFEADHPDVDVDVKIGGTALQSRFLLAMASGRGAPDVCQLQEREAGKYTFTGRLADLTAWAAKHEEDFPPSFWKSCVVDDRVYAIPWDIAPCAVFYKRWLFEKYDVNPDAIETWDDFIAAGRAIYDRSGGRTRLMPLARNALKDPFQILMLQAGGGVFDDRGRVVFDNPQNAEALALLRRLLDSGLCSPMSTSEEIFISYNEESVAAYPSAVWNMPNIKEASASRAGRWGVLRLPALRPGGIRNSNQGGSVLVIPGQSAQIGPASQFVEFALCTVDAQLRQYEQWGLFPAYLPAIQDPRFDTADPFFGGQHVARLFAEDFEKLPPLIRTRDWDEAEQIIARALFDWARLRKDDRQFLKETATLLSDRLGRPPGTKDQTP